MDGLPFFNKKGDEWATREKGIRFKKAAKEPCAGEEDDMLSKKSTVLFMLIVFFMIAGFMFWQTGLLLGTLSTMLFIFAALFAWAAAKVASPYKKEVNDILRQMEGGARRI